MTLRVSFAVAGIAAVALMVGTVPSHAFKLKIPNPVKVVKSAVKAVSNAPKNAVKAVKNVGDAAIHPGRTIERTGKNIGQTFKDASHGRFKPATVISVAVPGAGLGVAGATAASGPARGVIATSASNRAQPIITRPPMPKLPGSR